MAIEKARGVRDFSPIEMIERNKLVSVLRNTFERYGFLPLQTPMFERLSILTAKFAAGADSDAAKEIFKFSDQGNRELGLRFDLTVPLARYIAQNPNIKLPFKRYEIGRVYRDGPIKLGRYREFIQCDVDTIGVNGIEAEAELILLALDVFKQLGLDAYIEVNDRNILYSVLDYYKVNKKIQEEVIIVLDKLKKIGKKHVVDEIIKLNVNNANEIIETLTNNAKLKEIANTGNIDKLLDLVGLDNVIFSPTLARGLTYYTGMVFEGFLRDSEITSSICGGGRYDNLIGLYGNKEMPAVGISFGIEPITESLKLMRNAEQKSTTKVFIVPIQTFSDSLKITQTFRSNGINTEIDLMGKGISKNLNYANSQCIPYSIIVGSDELESGKFKLKDMALGIELELSLDEIIKKLK